MAETILEYNSVRCGHFLLGHMQHHEVMKKPKTGPMVWLLCNLSC